MQDYNGVMSNNAVIPWLIPLHASGATIALVLGAYQLFRRVKGDRRHQIIGAVWVVAMYWTVISSFFIQKLNPGHFSWIHGLSAFTFVTLSIGLWAAITARGRVRRAHVHRGFMTGSYLGLLGAFIGAVVVPVRDIPQWAMHQPLSLGAAALACVAVAAAVVFLSGRTSAHRGRPPVGNR
jgi:uncharacterized membrane protein